MPSDDLAEFREAPIPLNELKDRDVVFLGLPTFETQKSSPNDYDTRVLIMRDEGAAPRYIDISDSRAPLSRSGYTIKPLPLDRPAYRSQAGAIVAKLDELQQWITSTQAFYDELRARFVDTLPAHARRRIRPLQL